MKLPGMNQIKDYLGNTKYHTVSLTVLFLSNVIQ